MLSSQRSVSLEVEANDTATDGRDSPSCFFFSWMAVCQQRGLTLQRFDGGLFPTAMARCSTNHWPKFNSNGAHVG